jgi:hypothetical protein
MSSQERIDHMIDPGEAAVTALCCCGQQMGTACALCTHGASAPHHNRLARYPYILMVGALPSCCGRVSGAVHALCVHEECSAASSTCVCCACYKHPRADAVVN